MHEITLEELARRSSGANKRANALANALKRQGRIWGESLVLDKAIEVMSESQKASVFAEVLALTSSRSQGKTESAPAGFKNHEKTR